MEIEITQLLEEDMFQFSHSRMEGGENAGENTWRAALDGPRPLLTTPEQFSATRDYFGGFGAWTGEELNAMSENEIQALLLQFIAGDVREAGADSLDELDWEAYEADENLCHRLFRADDSRIYYSIGY